MKLIPFQNKSERQISNIYTFGALITLVTNPPESLSVPTNCTVGKVASETDDQQV